MGTFKAGDRVTFPPKSGGTWTDITPGKAYTVLEDGSFLDDAGDPRVVPLERAQLVDNDAPVVPSGSVASSLLTEAAEIVAGTRNATHGHKERSFKVIAEFWESYVSGRKEGREAPITARNVAQMMELLKIARSVQGEAMRDHFVDAAGYSAVAGELAELEGAA